MNTYTTTITFSRQAIAERSRTIASLPFKTVKWFLLLSVILFSGSLQAQTLVAGWDFQTTTNGGTATAASPATPKVYVANFGTGTIYFDGTNGSSTWFVPASGSTNTELNAFSGTAINAGTGFSTTTTGAASLTIVGGASQAANGKYAIFSFSMSGYVNLVVSYASQRTASGFTSHTWDALTPPLRWPSFRPVPVSLLPSIPFPPCPPATEVITEV